MAPRGPITTQGAQLTGVSCSSATSCTAVGWLTSSDLRGLSCGSGQLCTAAGMANDEGGVRTTLIETGD
jgi:hypothetical protein